MNFVNAIRCSLIYLSISILSKQTKANNCSVTLKRPNSHSIHIMNIGPTQCQKYARDDETDRHARSAFPGCVSFASCSCCHHRDHRHDQHSSCDCPLSNLSVVVSRTIEAVAVLLRLLWCLLRDPAHSPCSGSCTLFMLWILRNRHALDPLHSPCRDFCAFAGASAYSPCRCSC